MTERGSMPGVRRAIKVLETLADNKGGMTFNDLSGLFLDAPPSTVSRLLKTLCEENLIAKGAGEKNYRIGERSRMLGEKLCGKVSRAELLRPVVRALAEQTGYSAAYFELVDDTNTLIVKYEIPEAFHYMPEGNFNLNFTSHGCAKVLIAYQGSETRKRILGNQVESSFKELEQIIEKGVIINEKDDLEYISRIAAPVFIDEEFTGAIGVTLIGKQDKTQLNKTASAVKQAANDASDVLSQF